MKNRIKCLLNQIRDLRVEVVEVRSQNKRLFEILVKAQIDTAEVIRENFRLKQQISNQGREAA